MNESILIVDDEKEIADLIEVYLKNDSYTVYKFCNGMDALKCIEETELDLAIIDVMLPDIDGFRICRKIREKFYYPIIILTAKAEDGDKIMGLTIGADDYITKPFNPLEVTARVKTQLRRYVRYNNLAGKKAAEISEYDIRGLMINRDTHKCHLYGKELQLTPIEFGILWYLCEQLQHFPVQDVTDRGCRGRSERGTDDIPQIYGKKGNPDFPDRGEPFCSEI